MDTPTKNKLKICAAQSPRSAPPGVPINTPFQINVPCPEPASFIPLLYLPCICKKVLEPVRDSPNLLHNYTQITEKLTQPPRSDKGGEFSGHKELSIPEACFKGSTRRQALRS